MSNQTLASTPNREAEKENEMQEKTDGLKKDWMNIVLTGAFGVIAVLAGALITYVSSREQSEGTNARLYAELVSRREEADGALRKEMFNAVIQNFVPSVESHSSEKTVLNLELFAYNFNESLDLTPLFKKLYRVISSRPANATQAALLTRLEKVRDDVMRRQLETLIGFGKKCDATLEFGESGEKAVIIDVGADENVTGTDVTAGLKRKQVRLEVLGVEKKSREIFVRLIIGPPSRPEADKSFWIGPYDFPMLNNLRLLGGNRCAVVVRDFQEEYADITLVLFPGSRASLKEKPYYDEVMDSLRQQERLKPDK